jgi:hypothetical protein
MRSRLETFFINVPGCANHQLCSFHVALARAALLLWPASPAVIISFSTRFLGFLFCCSNKWRRTELFCFLLGKKIVNEFLNCILVLMRLVAVCGKKFDHFRRAAATSQGWVALFLQCCLDSWSASSLEIWCTHVSSVLINGYEMTGRCYGSMS